MACTHAYPALYGLGIRLAVYLNWAAAGVFNYLDQSVIPDIRLSTLVLTSSVTISMLTHLPMLSPAEMYILVLLSTGPALFLLPVYVWRVCTGWKPYWNPLYWSEEDPLRIFRVLNFVATLTAASLAVYFFTARAHDCQGFLFSKVALSSPPFIAFNAVIYVSIVIVCVLTVAFKSGFLVSGTRFERNYPRRCRYVGRLYVLSNRQTRPQAVPRAAAILLRYDGVGGPRRGGGAYNSMERHRRRQWRQHGRPARLSAGEHCQCRARHVAT